ncbi:MAG: DUF4142 domain-containing protein [Chthoniobacterales bacterium]
MLLLALIASVSTIANQGFAQTDAVTKEDKEFFKNAGELNMTEIELGRLAQTQAFSPEIKTLGATLQTDHAAMTADLVALAKQKGVEMDVEPTVTEKKMLAAFKGKTGAEFDREFREHVSKDHAKAIKMFKDAAEDSKDAEVKAFALKNMAALQGHLQAVGGKQ